MDYIISEQEIRQSMLDYASSISGYGSVLSDRELLLQQLKDKIQYLKSLPEVDLNLISIVALEYEDLRALPIVKVHEFNAPKNKELFNRYNTVLELIRCLNEENKDWVNAQFRKLKRDHLKNKYKF